VREGWPDLSKAARVHDVPWVALLLPSRRRALFTRAGPSAFLRYASAPREPVPGSCRRRGRAREAWLLALLGTRKL
jgi:hypothetical protein